MIRTPKKKRKGHLNYLISPLNKGLWPPPGQSGPMNDTSGRYIQQSMRISSLNRSISFGTGMHVPTLPPQKLHIYPGLSCLWRSLSFNSSIRTSNSCSLPSRNPLISRSGSSFVLHIFRKESLLRNHCLRAIAQ
jgi:hypothetical protein